MWLEGLQKVLLSRGRDFKEHSLGLYTCDWRSLRKGSAAYTGRFACVWVMPIQRLPMKCSVICNFRHCCSLRSNATDVLFSLRISCSYTDIRHLLQAKCYTNHLRTTFKTQPKTFFLLWVFSHISFAITAHKKGIQQSVTDLLPQMDHDHWYADWQWNRPIG